MLTPKLKPAVSKHWLFVLAGSMWSIVGIMLCRLAYGWLAGLHRSWAVALGALGLVLAFVVYRVGFSKIARKNIARLCSIPEKVCLFAFQSWKGYLIIGLMVPLGITLRHSPLPRHYLAIVYTTIGGALLLSSFHYYKRFWRVVLLKQPCLEGENNIE